MKTIAAAIRTCCVIDCGRRHRARGLCHNHYEALRRGRPITDREPLFDPTPVFAHLERIGTTSNRATATLLDVDVRQVERWRAGQRMRLATADRVAVTLGMHPGNLWPEWWTT